MTSIGVSDDVNQRQKRKTKAQNIEIFKNKMRKVLEVLYGMVKKRSSTIRWIDE